MRIEQDIDIAGFTLTELLVSLSLLSLLMVLIWTAYSFNLRVFAGQRERTTYMFQTSVVKDFLESHLERARPFVDQTNQRSGQIRFEGRRDEIRFISALSPRWGGLPQEFELSRDTDNKMVLNICSEIAAVTPRCDEPEETVLMEGVESLRLSYFDATREVWRENWVRERSMPDLIRVRIEDETGKVTEFIAQPRIDIDTTCYFDPVTRSCRGRG